MNDIFKIGLILILSIMTGLAMFFSWWGSLLFVAGLVVTGLIFKNYKYGLYLIVLTIPVESYVYVGPLKVFLQEVFFVITVLAFLVNTVMQKQEITIRSFYTPILFVLVVYYFFNAVVVSVVPRKSLFDAVHFLESVMLFYLVLNLVRREPAERARLLGVVVIAAVIQSCIGILQHFTGGFGTEFISDRGYLSILGLGSGRVWHAVGTMGGFNAFANYIGIALCVILPWALSRPRAARHIYLMTAIVGAAFIFTYSRGALLGMTGAALYIGFRQLPRRLFIVLLTLAVICAGVLAGRATHNYYYSKTVGYDDRKEIWSRPWSVIHESPKNFWLGTGLNTYEYVVPYPPNVNPNDRGQWFAHNVYILQWLSTGIIGLVLLLLFCVFVIVRNLRYAGDDIASLANIKISLVAVLILSLLHGIFDHAFGLIPIRNLIFILLPLALSP